MKTIDIKLKPCPWCGGKASLECTETILGNTVFWVECNNTNCKVNPASDYGDDMNDAIIIWNDRKQE